MGKSSLQDAIDETSGDVIRLLRDSAVGAFIYPVVPTEFSNWQREQRAWREAVALFDQSHHMDSVTIAGPGALELVSDTAVIA